MPRAFEKAVYTSQREKGQSMLEYTLAAVARFNELKREGVQLPAEARGYIMMRRAKLGDKGEDMIKTRTAGSFKEDEVIKALRRLDKVTTDRGDRQFFGEDESVE
eukprot:2482699-Pyramimonas_sp.AAC.1